MFLKDNELVIRQATADDAHTLGEWWRDGKVMAHAGFPLGLDTTDEEIAAKITDPNDTNTRHIIECDGEPIGEMNYRPQPDGSVEIGIKICRFDMQEKGYGTRLLRMFIRELFATGAAKIVLDTNLKNERAQHVYEKLGFRRTRVEYDAWLDQLGEKQSTVFYELLPQDMQ